ncbi:MAG TPA: O-antigen ligase family protein [Bryobacteraceae bacterium]|nr:O-antigen ligase family protein [Bryobacteraceae bacterium]
MTLFALAAGATLTIWVRDSVAEWIYEIGVCVLGAIIFARAAFRKPLENPGLGIPTVAVALIGMWGFGQLAAGQTVYRWATLTGGLRMLGLAATGLAAWHALERSRTREAFLDTLAWFGFLLSGVSVLAYFTSVGKVLWVFPAPYPDVWGPFLSRNNFAQFLELVLPVAWARGLEPGLRTESRRLYPVMAAVMLAAGLASASRAGAVLLLVESCAVFWLVWRNASRRHAAEIRRALVPFAAVAVVCGVLAGAGTVWVRLRNSDPLEYRREIYHSTLQIIREHPWMGTGLGTFSHVYPAYATFDSGAVVEHAHCDWLEWAAEGGLGYAAIWGLLSVWLVRPAIRSIWGLGVLAVLVHALVDYPFARFGVAAWAFILAGALARYRPARDPGSGNGSRSGNERTRPLAALMERSRV